MFLYFANSLFMKTTLISDWTDTGTARYYFDNGFYVAHSIKRTYKGGQIKEGRFEETINKYYFKFPIKVGFISVKKANEMKDFAFNQLDVMNKDMPFSGGTDNSYTTTFYQNFKTKIYYSEPYGYLRTLAELYSK